MEAAEWIPKNYSVAPIPLTPSASDFFTSPNRFERTRRCSRPREKAEYGGGKSVNGMEAAEWIPKNYSLAPIPLTPSASDFFTSPNFAGRVRFACKLDRFNGRGHILNRPLKIMTDYHINVFYSEEDAGYIADIPDLKSCAAFGETPEEALWEVLLAKAAWLKSTRTRRKTIPPPRCRSAIYAAA
jgi:predicted RNase H-like HicB family nuclease